MAIHGRSVLIALVALTACGGDPPAPTDAVAAGWQPRHDDAEQASDEGRFFVHQDGIEVRPGPNVSLWHPERTATGNYRLSADVTHLDSGLHPHGAGLVFGGSDVHGDDQRYTYILVRCDRSVLIKTRTGSGSAVVLPWTEHAAVAPEDDQGVTKNRLAVEVRADEVRFLVNGTEVHRAPRQSLAVDGQFGFRLVHDLHVRFGAPQVERLDPL